MGIIEATLLGALLGPMLGAGTKGLIDWGAGAYDKQEIPEVSKGFQPMSGTGRDSAAMRMLGAPAPARSQGPGVNYGIGSSYARRGQNDFDRQRAASQMMWG